MNIISMRQKVAKAIKKAPTIVTIMRDVYIVSGDEKTLSDTPKIVAENVEGLLDNSTHEKLAITTKELGTLRQDHDPKSHTVYKEGVIFRDVEYFINHRNEFRLPEKGEGFIEAAKKYSDFSAEI